VSPINAPTTCVNERFNVTGTLAFDGGGTGTFSVVLTHLRTQLFDQTASPTAQPSPAP
jgi:hypothetical protein